VSQVTLRFVATRVSAIAPIAMSLAALALLLLVLATGVGVAHDGDEGTAAHLWQLLMAGQLPVVGYFIVRWLPSAPHERLVVLAAQLGAGLAAAAPVFLLHL